MRVSSYLFASVLAFVSTVFTHGCGMFEFFEWGDLPEEVMQAAMGLGYDEMSWRDVRTNPVERIRFSELIDIVGTNETKATVFGDFVPRTDDIKGALMDLDFFDDDDGVCWDFWVNHYDGYDWEDLDETFTPFGENVKELLELLGWDQESWDDKDFTSDIPESECQFWVTLDPIQKWVYTSLGWNPASFGAAPCDPRCPKSLACPDNEE